MDFHSLNRRQLQSLCKLNHIPANITNVAMADALNSLQTVVGIEEIVNTSSSEVLSPRASCTSFRTTIRKKVKKPETESLLATASRGSRGVRKELTGEANEFLKTPAVLGVRKKGTSTLTSDNTGKKDATVQRAYNTRRSARLTAKKCTESGVTERDISRPVKIASFSEEVSVASEKSAGSAFSSVDTFFESCISSENTEDSDAEGSGENCDEGISKAKVEGICIKFEKLDVVIEDGSDQSKVIEKVNCCSENLDVDEELKVKEMFISNELQGSEEKGDQVENINPDSKSVSNPCDYEVSGEKMMVGDEKIDSHEALDVSVDEHLVLEQHSDSLLSDEVLSGEISESVDCCCDNVNLEETQKVDVKFVLNEPEAFEEKSDQVDNIKLDSKSISNPCDNGNSEGNVMVGDEDIGSHETLNVSVKEHLAPEEHSDNGNSEGNVMVCAEVSSGENSERVDFCDENVDLEEIRKVDNRFIPNEPEVFEGKENQVDDIKPDSEGITNSCDNVDSEENLVMVDEKIEPYEALNVSAKVLTEADGSKTDSISCDTENPSDPVASVSEMKDGIDFHEALNVSIDKYLEHSDSLLCDKVVSEAKGSDADSISCDIDNSNDPLVSVSEMKNEVLECNSFTNNKESSSELSTLDNRTDHNVAMTMTAEPGGIEENISTNQGDKALVNPNEQERSKDYETSEESQNFLIKKPAVDQEKETVTLSDDVINHATHSTSIKNETSKSNNSPTSTRETSQVSEGNENIVRKVQEVIVEDDDKKAEDEKPPTSLNDTSMRQLKKQLKALSIKSNLNTNKDDQVVEARSVLQAMCDSHLATGEAS